MAIEDFAQSEVAIAVAATVAAFSPPVRRVLRRGAVYGIAGFLMARDAAVSLGRGVGSGVQQATVVATTAVQETAARAKAPGATADRTGSGV